MDKIVMRASWGSIIIYLLVGIFGYLTFADNIEETLLHSKTNGNILECDYKGSTSIEIVKLSTFYFNLYIGKNFHINNIISINANMLYPNERIIYVINKFEINDTKIKYSYIICFCILYICVITSNTKYK